MDDKLFKQKLSEVADWRIPESLTDKPKEPARPKKRGRPSLESLYQEEHENAFLELHNGTNPTYPPEILRVRCQPTDCADCGAHCPRGRKKEKKLYEANKKRHWRERCVTCGLWQNPFTGAFDLPTAKASAVWNSYVRDTKGIYNTKGNEQRALDLKKPVPQPNLPVIEHEDDCVIIRNYSDITPER